MVLGLYAFPWPVSVPAAVHHATSAESLQAIIVRVSPGDTIVLSAGRYQANLHINKPLALQGEPGAILDGGGQGDVLRISAPKVTVTGLTIRNSGVNLTAMNAGIFAEKTAHDLLVQNNRLDKNAFGLWLDGCRSPRVLDNRIRGNAAIRSQDRGNGIHLFNVQGGEVAGNEVWQTRDGIYIDTSRNNILHNNHLHHLRYGIHYMYSYRNQVTANRTDHTRSGYALMQSKYLTVTGNRSQEDDNYGILLNFITNSVIHDNHVWDVRRGGSVGTAYVDVLGSEGKALFVYNSLYNTIEGNLFAGSDIGIHLTAGSEDNTVTGNAFVDNHTQVKYVANREQEWSSKGRGNYWSDYLGWDRDSNGIGDVAYEPNDAIDKLLWEYPLAKVLMRSPAIETLRWVQTQFPIFRPQGVRDSYPLMAAPFEFSHMPP